MANPLELQNMGERLKVCRKVAGLSQLEFAEFLGIKQAALSKYENNKLPVPTEVIGKLIKLGWSGNWLILGENSGMPVHPQTFEKNKEGDEKYDRIFRRIRNLKPNQLKIISDLIRQMEKADKLDDKQLSQ